MTDRTCIASGGNYTPSLSIQDALSCCEKCTVSCSVGGFSAEVWYYWIRQGLVSGSDVYGQNIGCMPSEMLPCTTLNKQMLLDPSQFEYPTPQLESELAQCQTGSQDAPPCDPQCRAGFNGSYATDKYFGKSAYKLPANNVHAMMSEIYLNGPVQGSFLVYPEFQNYQNGVYRHYSSSNQGRHFIKIIGWGLEPPNDTPYWIVANSWGPLWGENGFFKILRGSDESEIEENIIAGLAEPLRIDLAWDQKASGAEKANQPSAVVTQAPEKPTKATGVSRAKAINASIHYQPKSRPQSDYPENPEAATRKSKH